MDATRNPYSPGAGVPPHALVGRDTELELWRTALLRVASGAGDRGLIVHGLRGVGKTVLLGQMRAIADEYRWLTIQIEARPGLTEATRTLTSALTVALRPHIKPSLRQRMRTALASFTGFRATIDPSSGAWTLGVDLAPAPTTGDLETDLTQTLADLAEAIGEESGTGVAVLVDEMQDLDTALMSALAAAAHHAAQRRLPLLVSGAGLPSLPGRLSSAKTYSERLFHFRSIAMLGAADARRALLDPAADQGVTWEPAAADTVLAAAAGYPYFLQEFGQSCWDVAPGPAVIAQADADAGIRRGFALLDEGFFRARWDRATPSERRYLTAMAVDEGPSSVSEVARRLDRSPQGLGTTRAALIGKGLIFAPDHGLVAFTVPYMAGYVRRQHA